MSPGAVIGSIIIAIGLIAAAIVFAIASTLLSGADGRTSERLMRLEEAISAAERSAERLRGEVEDLRGEVAALREERPTVEHPSAAPNPVPVEPDPGVIEDHRPTEAPVEEGKIDPALFNRGLTSPGNKRMIDLLGRPRDNPSTDCQPVTNPRLKALLETRDFGRFRVTMIRPALDSLEQVMETLKADHPDLHDAIGTAGALCARLVRGSVRSISNHSWGTAIDVKLAGELDDFADGNAQAGLVLLAEAFNDEGWYWGATYGREDSMHFEVAEETLRRWHKEGRL